jgi:precorrin-2/cobalt-factor-2 C20-methyltransferase
VTLYGVGLGPGEADLVTVRGKRILEDADVVYMPGRLSRTVTTEHVPEAKIGDLDVPMTRDEEELREAWRDAAADIAPEARAGDAAFVTLGDPDVYALAGLALEILEFDGAGRAARGFEVVPGVPAAQSCAARVAAPLVNDTVSISLSDHLTDMPTIESRLHAAAEEGLTVSI